MKLIKSLMVAVAILGLASPSYAQNSVLSQVTNALSGRANLPPTNLDSFVFQSGMNPEIYGDEGDINIPPLFSFQKQNRINAGINGVDAAGLTTGHGSFMPDAWGADEFLAPPGEWDMTGGGPANPSYSISATALNAMGAAQAANLATQLSTTPTAQNMTSAVSNSVAAAVAQPVTYMTNPPAWVSAFGQWATQTVPYALTQGMVPVQNSATGELMGWMAPGQSLSQFLNGSTGMLLSGQTAAAQTMLANLTPANNYVVPTAATSAAAN